MMANFQSIVYVVKKEKEGKVREIVTWIEGFIEPDWLQEEVF